MLTEDVSDKTIDAMDKLFFETTHLKKEKKSQIEKIFKDITQEVNSEFKYKLLFRKGGKIGPNAFALPSGKIIITDELIELSENENELSGIFVHEKTHIEERHAIRNIFQKTGIFLLISAVVGDAVSITSIASTLPTILIESKYSQKFEMEADRKAAQFLIKKINSTKPYKNILLRILKKHEELPGESFFSTHPVMKERLKNIELLDK